MLYILFIVAVLPYMYDSSLRQGFAAVNRVCYHRSRTIFMSNHVAEELQMARNIFHHQCLARMKTWSYKGVRFSVFIVLWITQATAALS